MIGPVHGPAKHRIPPPMTDHISRFVSDDGFALSYVRCEATAELVGHQQHKLSGATLEFATKGMIASLLMGTRLKGRGMLSLNVQCDLGRIRDFRCDAMGMGYVRALIRTVDDGDALIGNGNLTVMKQIEGSDQPFQSTVPINHDRFIHACNAYLRSSEQVQALMCYDITINENTVERANGFYLERLPAADKHPDCHLSNVYDELYESKQDYVRIDDKGNDEEVIGELFGKGELKKLRQYDVQFHCPCNKQRYADTLRAFGKDQLKELVNEKGVVPTICDFCLSEYEIPLDDLI